MTTTATPRRKDHVGNGVLTTYPFPFLITAAEDLKVYVSGVLKTNGIHYTVTGTFPGIGNVVFSSAYIPALNEDIIVESDTPITQPSDAPYRSKPGFLGKGLTEVQANYPGAYRKMCNWTWQNKADNTIVTVPMSDNTYKVGTGYRKLAEDLPPMTYFGYDPFTGMAK